MRTPDRSIRPMRAAILHAHGAIPELGEFRDPEPARGDEVVEIVAAGMNPVDIRIAGGQFALERHEPPYVAGKEGVGRRADGSLVYFEYSREPFGAFAERDSARGGQRLPAARRARPGARGLPRRLRARRLAVAGVARRPAAGRDGARARRQRRRRPDRRPGREAARRRARRRGRAQRRGAGAGAPAGRRRRGRAGRAPTTSRARCARRPAATGYDVVLDPLWGEPLRAALGAAAPFARIVALGQSAGAEASLASAAIRSTPVDLLGYTNYTAGEERKAAAYERLARHAAAGEIAVEIERIGLDDVPDAWQRQGSSPGASSWSCPWPSRSALTLTATSRSRDRARRALGEARVRLLEVPAERAPAGPLAADHGQQRGQRARRQRGDQALQPQRGRERRRVRVRERAVGRERLARGSPRRPARGAARARRRCRSRTPSGSPRPTAAGSGPRCRRRRRRRPRPPGAARAGTSCPGSAPAARRAAPAISRVGSLTWSRGS